MTISKQTHELYTYKFYPRAHYYHKRGLDLYQRFQELLAVFPGLTHIKERIDDINRDIQALEKPPRVLVHGNGSLDLSDIVVSMAPMRESYRPYVGNGINIIVVYVEIERADAEGLQEVKHVIEGCLNEDKTIVKDTVFIMCRIRMIDESDLERFRQSLSNILQEHFESNCPLDEVIVISPNDGCLKDKISNHLERGLLNIFDKMRSYLQRFLTSVHGQIEGEIIDQPAVDECLRAFVGNKWHINDIINQRESQTESSQSNTAGLPPEERYLIFVSEELAMVLKCAISNPLSVKYKLPLWLCSDMLTGMASDQKFREALSTSTKSIMKRLFRFREHERGYTVPAKTDKHEYMVQKIKLDLSKTFIDIEKIMNNTREMTFIMEKMVFEIGGYFKQSVVWKYEVQGQPDSYRMIKKAILGVNHVYGVGTVYGRLEVHLKQEDSEAKSEIQEILHKQMYTKPYSIKVIEREPVNLADLQHEHGKTIYLRIGERKISGTLGGFVENGQKTNLYVLTCAHVVRVGEHDNDQDVFVEERQMDKRLGVSTSDMALFPGEVPMVDIAAVRVMDDIRGHCDRFLKDDEGFNRLSELADPADPDLYESLYVYKYGSATNLTKGLVCSHDYMMRAMHECGLNTYVMLIESLPANINVFAKEGDSGAIVCLPTPGSDKITALSMLSTGDFKLAGDTSMRCLTFLLKNGLQEIFRKSREELFLCTP